MNKYGSKIAKCILFLLPYAMGVAGFTFTKEMSAPDALFNSIQLYTLNYGDTPPNLLVEIARWLAPLATLSGIMVLFQHLKERMVRKLRYLRGDSVAVYGNEQNKDILLRQLGSRGINGGAEFVRANRYILVGTEQENLDFYSRHRDRLADCQVYLKSESIRGRSLSVSHLRPFRMEELAARLFWKQRFLYPVFQKNGGTLDIVLLGFGRLGEELLTFGLQNLIYTPDQQIRWHLFGDGERFLALHPELDQMGDPIRFYRDPWYEHRDLLERADLVAVIRQEEQSSLLEELLSVLHRRHMDVLTDNADAAILLNEDDRLRVFDWKREAQKLEHILEDDLLTQAKRINLRYAHLHGQVEETEENREREWDSLNTFTRYSNISAADYHDVRIQMLEADGMTRDEVLKNPGILDRLAQLEHIRWCRYHYLNNWIYGVPENGKSKDPASRIHMDLVPYAELSEDNKEKDRENIRVLFSVS